MPEIVECLGSAEASSERADPATQALNQTLTDFDGILAGLNYM
jgi:hypothetical protein